MLKFNMAKCPYLQSGNVEVLWKLLERVGVAAANVGRVGGEGDGQAIEGCGDGRVCGAAPDLEGRPIGHAAVARHVLVVGNTRALFRSVDGGWAGAVWRCVDLSAVACGH